MHAGVKYGLNLKHTERQRQRQRCHFRWNTLWRLGMGLGPIFKRHHFTIDQHWPMTLTLSVVIPLGPPPLYDSPLMGMHPVNFL